MSLDELTAKGKELLGKATGDKRTEAEGKTESTLENLKDKAAKTADSVSKAANDVSETVKGAVDGVKNAFKKDEDETQR
ncbi:CsbD family protein [Tuanshanicoccus lijuaniae]|uniref:CsbD family protein n=1 Tax=Aerococcaceae bacterium zg-1292 TaxID=2774330 RepID=UPI0019365068|nr:CsbD family protein [Aerococcaceae bacterium zg-1292]MBF6625049.1 CsbD family protein [Aerococcaceae bacterium zg-BR9]MBF6978167.1 CsbD family protein [Aerococcaceae bacterium zg-BR22]MBS4456303.1 CsbD family protein [Aerococcaceae bacterium zg-A91]MBS4458110.1 CsbD family protein [Aerococcaceae bacterium zg-BR33]